MAIAAVRRVAVFRALWAAVRGATTRRGGPSLGTRLAAVPRMVVRTVTGRYPGMTRGRLALMVGALVYLISPIDLVPEAFLLLLGLADDLVVAAWLAGTLLGETERYLAWEKVERQTVRGEVITTRVVS